MTWFISGHIYIIIQLYIYIYEHSDDLEMVKKNSGM